MSHSALQELVKAHSWESKSQHLARIQFLKWFLESRVASEFAPSFLNAVNRVIPEKHDRPITEANEKEDIQDFDKALARIVSMSNCYHNVRYLGCRYDEETMRILDSYPLSKSSNLASRNSLLKSEKSEKETMDCSPRKPKKNRTDPYYTRETLPEPSFVLQHPVDLQQSKHHYDAPPSLFSRQYFSRGEESHSVPTNSQQYDNTSNEPKTRNGDGGQKAHRHSGPDRYPVASRNQPSPSGHQTAPSNTDRHRYSDPYATRGSYGSAKASQPPPARVDWHSGIPPTPMGMHPFRKKLQNDRWFNR